MTEQNLNFDALREKITVQVGFAGSWFGVKVCTGAETVWVMLGFSFMVGFSLIDVVVLGLAGLSCG